MSITLRYHCPVYVVFDEDTGIIDRVVVGDDQMTDRPDLAIDEAGNTIEGADLEALHAKTAVDQDWPGWEFGF